jgi:hemerythrin-like domain-containing protein
MSTRAPSPRRRDLLVSSSVAGLVLVGACRARDADSDHPPVTAVEDLMREHGVVRRVLLVYDEVLRRLDDDPTMIPSIPLDALRDVAGLVRRFVEGYHERIEEEELFPLFDRAQSHAALVATLVGQHAVGRELTEHIRMATLAPLDDTNRADLARALRGFIRIYRPHAAREDTVLFPAVHELVGANAYRELGERFEEREQREFGHEGFEHAVNEIAKLESAFGIDALALPTTS